MFDVQFGFSAVFLKSQLSFIKTKGNVYFVKSYLLLIFWDGTFKTPSFLSCRTD